ncbi:hypothetical protein KI387_035412, partial [Taxus chinensis]
IRVPRVPSSRMSQYELSLFRANRPVRVITAQMSQFLPDCLFSFRPISPVHVLHVLFSRTVPLS